MKYENKEMKTSKETGKALLHDFMFPHSPTPITIQAETREEAEKKFEEIISKEKES